MMKNTGLLLGLLWALGSTWDCSAEDQLQPLVLHRVTDNVFSAIGVTGPPSYANAGHNNNLSVIVSQAGVVVINGGDNYLLAKRLHLAIRALTEQPVVWVVNENGQGHAFLGNSYWRDQKVNVIAHADAVRKIKEQGSQILQRMVLRNKDKARQTYVAVPDHQFTDTFLISLEGLDIELRSFGEAHSPGDISVWLPGDRVLITGDIAFHQRMLAIFPDTNVSAWMSSFRKMRLLQPVYIIPGHGAPTDMASIHATTFGYLEFLTQQIQQLLDDDADLSQAYAIDQTRYRHLDAFEELAAKNAGRLFQTMEMEMFQ